MNNRKIKIVIIIAMIIVVGILLLRYVFYDRYKMPGGAKIEMSKDDILVYSEGVKLNELIKDSNVDILSEDIELDTNSIGEHNVTIEYKYKGIRKYKYDVTYNVVDNTAPIFISGLSSYLSFYVNEATEDDLKEALSKVTYADDYDVYPSLSIDGEIDFSKVGTYNLTINIADSSNNVTSKNVEVSIIKRPTSTYSEKSTKEEETNKDEEVVEDDDNGKISFKEHIKDYKTKNTMVGIDVSKWQGEIDFEKVKDAGCEFVIMRIGVMKDKDSELVKDSTFDDNYKNAKKAGLKVGLYVYSEANNVDTAISNAEFIISTLDGDKLDFPVVFDWESWSYFNDMEMNLHMLNDMYDAFSKRLNDAGYESMLYASEYYLNNVWLDLKDYTIWIAKYSTNLPEITNGENGYILWQNACTGRIDGIDGDVDLDIYYR